MMTAFGMPLDKNMLDLVFMGTDTNMDGVVDFKEFMAANENSYSNQWTLSAVKDELKNLMVMTQQIQDKQFDDIIQTLATEKDMLVQSVKSITTTMK